MEKPIRRASVDLAQYRDGCHVLTYSLSEPDVELIGSETFRGSDAFLRGLRAAAMAVQLWSEGAPDDVWCLAMTGEGPFPYATGWYMTSSESDTGGDGADPALHGGDPSDERPPRGLVREQLQLRMPDGQSIDGS